MEQYKRKEGWDSREGQLLCKRNDTKSRTIVKKRSVKTNQKKYIQNKYLYIYICISKN